MSNDKRDNLATGLRFLARLIAQAYAKERANFGCHEGASSSASAHTAAAEKDPGEKPD